MISDATLSLIIIYEHIVTSFHELQLKLTPDKSMSHSSNN